MAQKLPCEVWITDNEVIILGTPADEPDENKPMHHCDEMGCGYAHVLFRAPAAEQLKASASKFGDKSVVARKRAFKRSINNVAEAGAKAPN